MADSCSKCHCHVNDCICIEHRQCIGQLASLESQLASLKTRLAAAEYALMRYAIIPDEDLTSGIREAVEAWRKIKST